jgi:hypothetical protein
MTRMRRFVLLTVAAVLFANVPEASAQRRFQGGVKVGPSFTNIAVEEGDVDEGEFHRRIAAAIGGFFALTLAGPVAVQVEALSMPKGSRLEFGDGMQTLKLAYFEVPVLLRLAPARREPGGWYFFGGGYFAVRTSAKAEYSMVINSISSGSREDASDLVERYDRGWTGGAGLDIGRFVVVEGRYSRGFTNVNRVADSTRFVNHGATLMVGLRY